MLLTASVKNPIFDQSHIFLSDCHQISLMPKDQTLTLGTLLTQESRSNLRRNHLARDMEQGVLYIEPDQDSLGYILSFPDHVVKYGSISIEELPGLSGKIKTPFSENTIKELTPIFPDIFEITHKRMHTFFSVKEFVLKLIFALKEEDHFLMNSSGQGISEEDLNEKKKCLVENKKIC